MSYRSSQWAMSTPDIDVNPVDIPSYSRAYATSLGHLGRVDREDEAWLAIRSRAR